MSFRRVAMYTLEAVNVYNSKGLSQLRPAKARKQYPPQDCFEFAEPHSDQRVQHINIYAQEFQKWGMK